MNCTPPPLPREEAHGSSPKPMDCFAISGYVLSFLQVQGSSMLLHQNICKYISIEFTAFLELLQLPSIIILCIGTSPNQSQTYSRNNSNISTTSIDETRSSNPVDQTYRFSKQAKNACKIATQAYGAHKQNVNAFFATLNTWHGQWFKKNRTLHHYASKSIQNF